MCRLRCCERVDRAKGAADEQILETIVVVIREDSHAGAIQAGKSGGFCHILKRSVAPVAEQLGRHSVRNKQIVEAVVVKVDGGNAAGAVEQHFELQGFSKKTRI